MSVNMSFLDSVLSSIETGKPAQITPPPTTRSPAPPVSSSNAKTEPRKPGNGTRAITPGQANITAGMKRKAEEPLRRPQKPAPQTLSKPAVSKPVNTAAPSKPRQNISSTTAKLPAKNDAPVPQKASLVSSKPPPKGSFADLMMQAKALQDKAPTQVGMFKHQAVAKEKLSKMERKRRAMETQAKEKDQRSAKKPGAMSSGVGGIKPGDGKLGIKREPEKLSYKGTSRPTHSAAQSEYRGTAGLPSRLNGNDRKAQSRASKRSKMDEYLGTDEEDEGEFTEDYDDYYSESSDMEAGLGDMEKEEAAALKAAKKEDEEEWRAELAAKEEKLERRKKLTALASRSKY